MSFRVLRFGEKERKVAFSFETTNCLQGLREITPASSTVGAMADLQLIVVPHHIKDYLQGIPLSVEMQQHNM